MKLVYPFAMIAAGLVWAQTPATKPADPAAAAAAGAKAAIQNAKPAPAGTPAAPRPTQVSLMSLPADKVVATVDGNPVTAGDLQAVLRTLPSPQLQQQALSNRRMLLEQYGVARRLAAEAEKVKLEESSPWKEAIANMRMQVLANAYMNRKFLDYTVPTEDQKKYYESNPDRFAQAKVKAIFIKFYATPTPPPALSGKKPLSEAEAKAKAEELVKQLRGGADFVKLVKENSDDPTSAAKDGDFGSIRRSDRLPPDLITAVFKGKAGEVTDPVRQNTGYYIFRVEEISTQPFEQVQPEVMNQLREVRFQEWLQGLQKSIDIKMADEASPSPSLPLSPAPIPPAK